MLRRLNTLLLPTLLGMLSWLSMPGFAHAQIGELMRSDFTDFGTGNSFAWSDIEHDRWGRLYLAIDRKILFSRGEKWHPLPDRGALNRNPSDRTPPARIADLFIDDLDRLWVGASDDVGYYQLSETAPARWVSLHDKFPHPEGRSHWQPQLFDPETGRVYFSGFGQVIAWHPEKETLEWEVRGSVNNVLKMRDGIIAINSAARFLNLLPDETVEPVFNNRPNNPIVPKIHAVEQRDENSILLATEGGVFEMRDQQVSPWPLRGNGIPEQSAARHLAIRSDGTILVLLLESGLLVKTDDQGSVLSVHQAKTGLIKTRPDIVFVDRTGAMWIADATGLHHLMVDIPISVFGLSQGISGIVHSFVEHDGRIYVATSSGLFESNPDNVGQAFKRVGNIGDCSNLRSTANGLLFGSGNGLMRLRDGKLETIGRGLVRRFEVIEGEIPRLVAPRRGGLRVWEEIDGEWWPIPDFEFEVGTLTVVKAADGALWFRRLTGEVTRWRFEAGAEHFDYKSGLPPLELTPLRLGDRIVIGSADGQLYEWVDIINRFTVIRDAEWGRDTEYRVAAAQVVRIGDQYWAALALNQNHFLQIQSTGFEFGLRWLAGTRQTRATAWMKDAHGHEWFGSRAGVVCLDAGTKITPPTVPAPTLNHVFDLVRQVPIPTPLDRLSNEQRSLRFEFELPEFASSNTHEFSSRLHGFDEIWTEFRPTASREYTNLPPGDYALELKARNLFGESPAPEIGYFTIAPPFYLAWWSITLWCTLAAVAIWGAFYLRQRSLALHNSRLSDMIHERTNELAKRRAELAEQNEELTEALAHSRELTKAAEAAAEAKGMFLANMSHEIRTPMNGVIGMCTLLSDTKLDNAQQDFVRTIRNSGESLLTIINDILDFSKIEAGMFGLETTSFDLVELAEDVMELLAPAAHDKELELVCTIENDIPATRSGDPTRIRQILVNLVGNAVKFTEHGEVILHITAGEADELIFAVTDTGSGIPAAKLKDLFQPFTQVDNSTARRHGGTGLGLAISHRLAELMGGSIKAESVENRGSTFTFRLKLPIDQNQASTDKCIATLRDKHVLILDDHETNRVLFENLAKKWGMTSVSCAHPADTSEALTPDAKFDLAWVDYQMPDTTGAEWEIELRKNSHFSTLPVVLLSSVSMNETLTQFRERPHNAHLAKPVRRLHLARASARLLGLEDSSADQDKINDLSSPEPYGLKLLLAEDNLVNQKVAKRLLEKYGCEPDIVANGVEAIVAVKRQHYDVIVMDVQMPEMDGMEATKCIRRDFPASRQPHIIALTAGATSDDREGCIEAGMDQFITKPVRVAELHHALAEAKRQHLAKKSR